MAADQHGSSSSTSLAVAESDYYSVTKRSRTLLLVSTGTGAGYDIVNGEDNNVVFVAAVLSAVCCGLCFVCGVVADK